MLQNRQSRILCTADTARKSKERPSPNHSPTTRLHSLTSYLTYHRNGEWGFPYSPFSGLQEVWTHRQWVSFLTSSLRHPKIFIKEFGDFLMPCHQHSLCISSLFSDSVLFPSIAYSAWVSERRYTSNRRRGDQGCGAQRRWLRARSWCRRCASTCGCCAHWG